MATHSSLAWRIPWTEELVRLHFIGLHRVRHSWSDSMHASSDGYCLTFISPNSAQNTFPCTIHFSICLSFLFQKLNWYISIYISRVHECILYITVHIFHMLKYSIMTGTYKYLNMNQFDLILLTSNTYLIAIH